MPTKRLSKNEVVTHIASETGETKSKVEEMLASLQGLASEQLRQGNEFIIPGILKLKVGIKPATQDRPGVNPFTKQPVTVKGKPASKKLKASPLKAFKDAVQ